MSSMLALSNSSLKACPDSDQMTPGLVSFVAFPFGFALDEAGIVDQEFLEY